MHAVEASTLLRAGKAQRLAELSSSSAAGHHCAGYGRQPCLQQKNHRVHMT